jgi:hypothetical protein
MDSLNNHSNYSTSCSLKTVTKIHKERTISLPQQIRQANESWRMIANPTSLLNPQSSRVLSKAEYQVELRRIDYSRPHTLPSVRRFQSPRDCWDDTWMFWARCWPIRLWMPSRFPSRLNRGPPESPCFKTQSVMIVSRSARKIRPSRSTGGRLR